MIKRKSYDKEFKLEAVHLVKSGKKVAEVAREPRSCRTNITQLGKEI